MQRNLKRNMSKPDVKVFHEEFQIIKKINDFDRAVAHFETLCKKFERKYPAYTKTLLEKKRNIFNI